ncbi:uroporphyrinogen-III synthase-like [Oratosquilla oratoria]|uniref:uroporphyrinogen-III synthase-like n=1 Tax=Oratosquilla oratoria TaxID=337810 RepID=UPI003F769D03
MTVVWLIKSTEDSDTKYSDLLNQHGFKTQMIPALSFSFSSQKELKNVLTRPQDHTGLVFTSPRAVQAVAEVYKTLTVAVHQEWRSKKVFVIGKATDDAVRSLLQLDPVGQQCGNAAQLAPFVIENTEPFDKPLFIPCGNLKRDELPRLLASQDRDFRAIPCYETKASDQLKPVLQRLVSSNELPTCMVFFSPSGVGFTLPILRELKVDLTGIAVIAIGPTTNSSLVDNSVPVFGVCPSPSPEGLLHTIKGLKQS